MKPADQELTACRLHWLPACCNWMLLYVVESQISMTVLNLPPPFIYKSMYTVQSVGSSIDQTWTLKVREISGNPAGWTENRPMYGLLNVWLALEYVTPRAAVHDKIISYKNKYKINNTISFTLLIWTLKCWVHFHTYPGVWVWMWVWYMDQNAVHLHPDLDLQWSALQDVCRGLLSQPTVTDFSRLPACPCINQLWILAGCRWPSA